MDLDKIYVELVSGKSIKLQFLSELAARDFINTFRVFVHRQNKRFRQLGMEDVIEGKGLRTKLQDRVLELSFLRKERKQYSFQILGISNNNPPEKEESNSSEEGKS